MPKQTLTDVGLRALKPPPAGQLTIWDANSPIGVRVSAGGSKTFIIMLGSGKRHTIGKFGVVTLADARTEGRRLQRDKALGVTTETSITFGAALPLFLEENYKGVKSKQPKEVQRLLTKHFLPAFKDKQLPQITDRDVSKELGNIKAPSTKLHAFRALRTMLNWCKRPPHRYLTHSPLDGYAAPGSDGKRSRILTDEELVKVWRAAVPPVQLLILWGTRRGETGILSPNWLGEDACTIPGEYTKNGRAHAIPILPMARAILVALPRRGPLFGLNDNKWRTLKRRLDKAVGFKNWTLHDLRRTFRSMCARLGVTRDLAEILLNHVSGKNKSDLDEIYDRYDYLEEKRDALAKIEGHLTQLLARY